MFLDEVFAKKEELFHKEIMVHGWIRNHRAQKEFGFLDFSDGTTMEHLQIVYDKDIMKNVYNAKTEAEIKKALLDKVKEINAQIPKYKAIRGMYITEEPLIKTTTNKIKRQDNLNAIK